MTLGYVGIGSRSKYQDQIRRVEEKHGGKKKLALADWPSENLWLLKQFWEPRCCPNWAKSCRRKPGNEAWASKASIEQTSKSLFWSSSHRPNGTKWLSESQVLSGNKKSKEEKNAAIRVSLCKSFQEPPFGAYALAKLMSVCLLSIILRDHLPSQKQWKHLQICGV